MLRSSHIGFGLAVTALLAFQLGGCSSGGGGGNGKGGTTGSAGSSSPGSGGSSSPGAGGTSSSGSGGSSSQGAGGSGGSSSPGAGGSGGSSSPGAGGTSAGGSGGSAAGGSGGSAAGGTAGSAAGGTGGSAAGGSGGTGTPGFGQPACAGTVSKGSVCTAQDVQLCYKNCGPQNIGRKSETCGPGADGGMTYAEMSGCSYDPAGTYACYKIPTTANAACPTGVPMGSAACTVTDSCTVCNDMGGIAGGMYMDSTSMKVGFCVCAGGKWACASNTAWPCGGTPVANNPGCQ